MKLAIITCQKLPKGVTDDQVLLTALNELEIKTETLAWNADVQWSKFDACLLRSVWDYHESPKQFSTWLTTTSLQTPIINSKNIILWNQNKSYLKDLADFGITIAPTLWLQKERTESIKQLIQSMPTKQYLLKPNIGADSSGTLRFENNQQGLKQAQRHLNEWLPHVDMMLQPYLPAVETFGETSAIYFNGSFSHAVRKIPQNGDYRVQDTFGAKDVIYQPNAAEMALSKACVNYIKNRFEQVMYARFDFLHDANGTVFLNEAELIEPSLFFNHAPQSARLFAQHIHQFLSHLNTS